MFAFMRKQPQWKPIANDSLKFELVVRTLTTMNCD